MSFHGATVEIYVQALTAEGKIDKEYLGDLNGSAADQNFYTKNFPITTGAGVETDDETQVDVFTDDLTPGTWSEYLDDGSDFEIDGSEGLVTIKAAENQAGNINERISISYYTIRKISRGQSVDIEWDGDVKDVHEFGDRNPKELKEGLITISGSIGALYTNRNMFGDFLGMRDFNERISERSLYIYPNKKVGGQPYIKVGNVKFTGGSLGASVDDIMTVGNEFKGLIVQTGTV